MRSNIRLIVLITIITSSFFAVSGQSYTKSQLARSVLNLRRNFVENDTLRVHLGTGLFIKHKGSFFIVTAAHVAKDMDIESYIYCYSHLENKSYLSLPLVEFLDTGNILTWENHGIADLSVLHLNTRDSITRFYLKHISFPSELISAKRKSPSVDTYMLVLGYPLGLIVKQLEKPPSFAPLLYRTFPASSGFVTLRNNYSNRFTDFFMLEDPSIGGYSGGPVFGHFLEPPVFAVGHEKTTCYGFIQGTYTDNTGGKLTIVTPSYFLFDLLE